MDTGEFDDDNSSDETDFLGASVPDLYNILIAGSKIEIPFSSQDEAETFRVSLAQFKMRQDKVMIDIGMMSEEEKLKFSFKYDKEKKAATLKFAAKQSRRFTFKIVEDNCENAEDNDNE